VYGWIWRKLPFGVPGKIIGSLLLVTIAVAALWYKGFPAAEPLLPFDDVNVTDQGGEPGGGRTGPGTDPSGQLPGDDHDIPYSTDSNQPSPGR
jgi:hypothetical protein